MEDEELAQLKTVYDEFWRDAKTMIKDVTRSISCQDHLIIVRMNRQWKL